ncbi:GNAT family N-acetyltransferase [Phycisphaera mikurensis]|uniref:Putative acetyltransferase n=1 Tax=Phycisphaera mikurensis (strain NBRC 102666 / KCTC 22515 / FYK2301M01) TaxID=1142394 RepID=I0IEG5_PHYMF|nr:GNAT family protein [Phycisphaera mikurensis]MBB6441452.1 RimJ/RimL family protein N-acetyltransferase [Phycisphaera mikurensis]BAM03653.1 putative acetyltransferase [Phycisphaera mikurensis NBRC 102666]
MEARPPLHWTPPPPLAAPRVRGHWLSIGPLDPDRDAAPLWEAFGGDERADHHLRWLGWDPLHTAEDLRDRLHAIAIDLDAAACLLRGPEGTAVGMAAYLQMNPPHGVVGIGYAAHGPGYAATQAPTEAHFLLIDHAFAAGYRRVEWKCNAGDEPSRRAADRLGFRFEGIARQHRVARDQNRDTACYALLDREWPERRPAFVEWLRPVNFDEAGKQRTRLRRRPIDAVRSSDPLPMG